MKKTTKSTKNKTIKAKNKAKNKTIKAPKIAHLRIAHLRVGRPQYTPVIPETNFTFTDFERINGVNPKTGKGKLCTTLTLRKWMKRDMDKKNDSSIIQLEDTFANPNNRKGLGRKAFVFAPRVAVKAVKTPKPSKTVVAVEVSPTNEIKNEVTVDVGLSQATQDYENIKAELLGDIAPTTAPIDSGIVNESHAQDAQITESEQIAA